MRLDIKYNNVVKQQADDLAFVSGIGENKSHSKAEDCFRCLITNMLDSLYKTGDCTGTLLLHSKYYTKPPITNGRSLPDRKLSYRYMVQVIDWLEDNDFIKVSVGGLLHYNYDEIGVEILKREVSKYEITEKFLNYFKDSIESYYSPPVVNVIKLRDKDKVDKPFKITTQMKVKKDLMQTYNNMFHGVVVKVNDTKHYIQLNKIYNLNFTRGGRSYMINGSFQNMSRKDRAKSVLDYGDGIEHKLCELDFKALHPSILYTREGILLEDTFDPYDVPNLKGFDKEQYRSVCKLALLILINASNYEASVAALKYRLILDRLPDEGKTADYPDIHDKLNGSDHDYEELSKILIKALKDKNKGIVKYFHSGEGANLMRIESDVMDNIIDHFLDIQVIILPVHDSAAIQEDYVDELYETMRQSYYKVLGTYDNCKIERKY